MFRQSARSGLRPDQKPPELSPAMGNYSCRQRGSLPVITRHEQLAGIHRRDQSYQGRLDASDDFGCAGSKPTLECGQMAEREYPHLLILG